MPDLDLGILLLKYIRYIRDIEGSPSIHPDMHHDLGTSVDFTDDEVQQLNGMLERLNKAGL